MTDFRGALLVHVTCGSCGLLSTLLTGDELAFVICNKLSFKLPLQHVANSNIAGRTEVSLEVMAPSDPDGKKASKGQPDEMVEIRFFVPGQSSRVRGSDAGSNKSDAGDADANDVSAAQAFHEAIKERAELGHVSGDIILSFEEVLVLTPRGATTSTCSRTFCARAAKRMVTRSCIRAYQDHSFYQKMTSIFSSSYAPRFYTQSLY